MKHKNIYFAMLRHSHFLLSAVNLSYYRFQHLEQTKHNLGLTNTPMDSENLDAIQLQTAKEIGGVNTKMLLDAPLEIEKYHFAPVQIACCLLYAAIEKYRKLVKVNPIFRDQSIDKYCEENAEFVRVLKGLRDLLLHPFGDNWKQQDEFFEFLKQDGHTARHYQLLLKGTSFYRTYLERLKSRLQGGNRNGE